MKQHYPGNIYMVVAPSGAGKSTLVNALLEKEPDIQLSISYTTRPPRPKEKDGVHYHFVSVDEFQALKEKNDLLEWAYVHGNYYGTSRSKIEEHLKKGEHILLEIDWQGAQQVREYFPNVIDIFILPPSMQALETRLHSRAQDSLEVIERRLKVAKEEMAHAHEARYVIINDQFDTALQQMQHIVQVSRLRYACQQKQYHDLFKNLGA